MYSVLLIYELIISKLRKNRIKVGLVIIGGFILKFLEGLEIGGTFWKFTRNFGSSTKAANENF
jgi:hypothetical protein